jgi:hypothetical protein
MTTKSPRGLYRRLSFAALAIIGTLIVLLPGAGSSADAAPPTCPETTGLQNVGFEAGGNCWTIEQAPDAAVLVTGSEGPAQFAAYNNVPGGPLTVTPKRGTKMFRLGTPKDIASSQTQGGNTISQWFQPNKTTIQFDVRLFSWEFRGNDTFSIKLTDANGNPVGTFGTLGFSLKTNQGTGAAIVTCSGPTPCTSTIDVGNRGDFLDSGWQTVTISGLNPAGGPLKLSYSVGGTNNTSHATWAYFDGNSPPVAKFTPQFQKVQTLGGPLEGAPIKMFDTSYDPDGSVVAWEWNITGPAMPATGVTLTSRNPVFVPSHFGTFNVRLKVTDNDGDSTTVFSGNIAIDGTSVPPVVVNNAPPLVRALNTDALANAPLQIVGRFADAGWADTHTATWTVGGCTVTVSSATSPATSGGCSATFQEDHLAALGTGITVVTLPAGVSGGGTLSVCDDGGLCRTDTFTVHVGSSIPAANQVNAGSSYLSYLTAPGERDWFEITWPGTGGTSKPLPAGTEIIASLKDLPADYDLVLVAVPPAASAAGYDFSGYDFSGYDFSGFEFSGFEFSGLPSIGTSGDSTVAFAGYDFSGYDFSGYDFSSAQRTSYAQTGYDFSGYDFSGYDFSGYDFSGYDFSGYDFSGYDFSGYDFSSLSQAGFNGLTNTALSATDLRLAQLTVGTLPPGAKVVGFSANRGLTTESVFGRVDVPGTKLYAVVVGTNGAFSKTPYRLQVEGSMPLASAAPLLSQSSPAVQKFCTPRLTNLSTTATTFTVPNTPDTLVITQEQRIRTIYGDAEWQTMATSLAKLATTNTAGTLAKVVSVPLAPYAAWDANPCDIDAANKVTSAIRAVITAELKANPSLKYIVFAGSDDIIPFRRVPDETLISNERYYLLSSFVKRGTPLFASLANGFNLTDDFYTTSVPTSIDGRPLYVPDMPSGRLIETPAEMAGQIEAYIKSGGLLNASTGTVSGYDFFEDGAAAIKALLAVKLTVSSLLSSDPAVGAWTAAQLRCSLGLTAGCGPAKDISAPFAHFAHYAGLSAFGFATHNGRDSLTTTDVVNSVSSLVGKILFTIGCHAGLNVPDAASNAVDPSAGINPALDFPQAFAQRQAIWVASTGFGIGDDEGLGGTEKLLVDFSKNLVSNTYTSGQALVEAKKSFIRGLSAVTVYDEKSTIQTTFYGLPMYRVATSGSGGITPPPPPAQLPSTKTYTSLVGALLSNASGSYYAAAGGDATAPAFRPLQPRYTESNVTGTDPTTGARAPIHGVLFKSSSFVDQPGFDPVIVRPTVEWETGATEPQNCLGTFWPTSLARVNSLAAPGTAGGPLGVGSQSLIVTPGQFRCDSGSAATVTGTQRLHKDLNFEVLSSPSLDMTPPSIDMVDVVSSTAAAAVVAIRATDPIHGSGANSVPPSGIGRVVVLRVTAPAAPLPSCTLASATPGCWGSTSFVTEIAGGGALTGSFEFTIPNPGHDSFIIQVADVAGNVTIYDAKGADFHIIPVTAPAEATFYDGVPVTFTATIDPNFYSAAMGPYTYFIDFGDGTTDSGIATSNVIAVPHTYSGGLVFRARVRVFDSQGGLGSARTTFYSYCRDPKGDVILDPNATVDANKADVIWCSVVTNGSGTNQTINITLVTTGLLTDSSGAPTTGSLQYRLDINPPSGGGSQLKYRDGQITGAKSLQVTFGTLLDPQDGVTLRGTITFAFSASDVALSPGQAFTWSGQTQAGAQATGGAGFLDAFPDTGTYPGHLGP